LSSRAFDLALAAVSGVLLALSFPKFGHPSLAWVALAPLLVAVGSASHRHDLRDCSLRRAMLLGLVTGIVYFTGTLYWITRVMAVYGGLQPWVAVLVNAALIAYLALFPAIFAIVTRRLVLAYGPRALAAAPVVWVVTELGRTHIFTGFPWVLLGYSQTTVLPVAQFASVFGVYGVSMLVASVSTAMAMVMVSAGPEGPAHLRGGADAQAYGRGGSEGPPQVPLGRPFRAAVSRFAPVVVVVLVLAGIAAWGARRAAAAEWTRSGDAIRVGLIQGNIDQADKQNPAHANAIFHGYIRMTRDALRKGAELVLWPESSTPFLFEDEVDAARQIRSLAQQAKVPILVGSDQVERTGGSFKYYNSAFLVAADGTSGRAYRKMHLVPFGEYVPLKQLLFFAAPLVEAVSDFSAGEDAVLLPVGTHMISTAICYEVVYPDLVRKFVVAGSELLTTITNDAWFGATSAPYQHFEQASMRAIEEGRYLVRSANTGISGIVDPYGRVLERTDIFQTAVLVGEARFLRTSTFYARHGDILAYASVVVTAVLLVMARRR
jgi:apolipoprotein N-acyltransferase